MAMSIKETPVLTGADTRKFEKAIAENKAKKIPSDEYKKAMASYRKFKVVASSAIG